MFVLKGKKVVTPLRVIDDGVVIVDGQRLWAVGPSGNMVIPEGVEVVDWGDSILAPGFIDIHHHGAVGERATGGAEAVKKIGRFLPSTGCTSWLPTVGLEEHCPGVVQAMKEGTNGADILGIHMEGPFLEPKGLPGRPEADSQLRPPDPHLLERIQEAAEGHVLIMGFGVRMEGALELIRLARQMGIVPAVAHTKATYEELMRAVDAGLKHATHIYNVMTPMHHRRPGVVGGALTCDQLTGELIGDGLHVHPVAMDVVIRCKGVDKVALITDQSELAGMPDGRYVRPNGVVVIKKNGICRMEGFDETQDNTMAGSTCTMDQDVRTLVDRVHLKLEDAIRMATLTPATIAGAENRKGSLEPGKDADIVVLGRDLSVQATYVRGRVSYRRE